MAASPQQAAARSRSRLHDVQRGRPQTPIHVQGLVHGACRLLQSGPPGFLQPTSFLKADTAGSRFRVGLLLVPCKGTTFRGYQPHSRLYAGAWAQGLVVFFPSFAYAEQAARHWRASGDWARLSARKRVFQVTLPDVRYFVPLLPAPASEALSARH